MTRLKVLDISGNVLTSLSATIFRNCTALEALYMGGHKLSQVPSGLWSRLRNLQHLDFRGRLIENRSLVPADMFAHLVSLRTLYLRADQIMALPAQALADLAQLQALHLWYGNLTSMSDTALATFSKLKELRIESTVTTRMERGFFIGMSSLEAIAIKNNRFLTALDPEVFSSTAGLKVRLCACFL